MDNITEIVYGDSLCHWLKQSDFIGNNEIIKFDKLFSIADLSDINDNKIKYSEDFCNFSYDEIYHRFDNINSLDDINKQLDEAVKRNNKIRVWTTHNEIESYLTFLYVCNYLFNINCNLYVMFSDEYNKECFSPACMVEKKLKELIKLEHKLSTEEIFEYALEWKCIVNDNSELRVIENDKVKFVSLNYYDDIILNKLKEFGEIQTIKLASNLMNEYHLYDLFIAYLINRLINSNKIKIVKKDERLWKSTIMIVNN